MEDHPTFSPFAIEFEDHRDVTRKYLRSPFSQKTSGNDYNPAIAKKQKAALSLELKRNARKIGKYLKESETVKKLVKVHIDNQNLSGPYLEPRTKFAQEMHKTIQSPVRTLSNAKAESILRSTLNKSNSTLVNTRVTNIDLSNSVDPLSSITVIRDKTLPDILPKDNTPASCKVLTTWTTKERMDTTITDKIEEGVIVPMETVEFMTLREKKEVVSPSESPAKRRTPSWGTGNLKNFLTKYSYKPKGNAVDKFVDAYCLAMNNKSPRNVETAKPRRMDLRGISFNDSQISKSAMEVEQRYNSQEKSVLEKSTLTKLTTLPQIEEFPVKKIRPRGALYLPKNPPKEELSDSMKTFKELYKSCNKLVSNLSSLDRKLTNRENRLNNKYANLQVRLDKIRDVHFLPQKFVLNEEL